MEPRTSALATDVLIKTSRVESPQRSRPRSSTANGPAIDQSPLAAPHSLTIDADRLAAAGECGSFFVDLGHEREVTIWHSHRPER
jgi:hypothetical protein